MKFALTFIAVILSSIAALAAERPNVLFIMADDFRTELASYGSVAKTPHLDRLAKRSLQFDRAYCQQALCNPSRSSMLTGKRPDTLRLWHNGTHFRDLNPDVVTMPQWFKQHGYETRCVGKIFHNWHTAEKGDRRSWSTDEFLHYANHGDDKPQVDGTLPPDFAKAPKCECRDVPDSAYYDGRVAQEAVRVFNDVKSKSFFLAVGFWKPHAPFNAPKKYWDMYDRSKLPPLNPARPANAPEVAFHDGREIRGIPPNQVTFSAAEAAEIRHGYFANISYLDTQIGKVLDALDASGQANNTVIVFAGDHGYHLGEHSLWAKTSNFEFDARVPLFISRPGMQTAGQRTSSLTELLDLFPTLVNECNLPSPGGLEGLDLAPLFADSKRALKQAAATQHPRPAYFDREPEKLPKAMGYSIRTERVRYTEWRDWKSGELVARELYDHSQDPTELVNAIDRPKLAKQQADADRQLRATYPSMKR